MFSQNQQLPHCVVDNDTVPDAFHTITDTGWCIAFCRTLIRAFDPTVVFTMALYLLHSMSSYI